MSFFVGTKACSVTKVNDDHDDLPVQIETQNVDVENGNEIDAFQMCSQGTMAQVVGPPVVDPPLLQPDSGQGQNRLHSWLELLP